MRQGEFFRANILAWEGGLSLDPADRGNWFAAPGCAPRLVGSCYGVTGATLARFRSCSTVTAQDMAALTLDEAVRVGERLFYREPGLDRLPWDPVVASAVDFGWGAGPGRAVALLQRLAGCADDGLVGQATLAAYARLAVRDGLPAVARRWHEARDAYYRAIVARRPAQRRFLSGWLRRSASFLPGTAWWLRFNATAG